MRVIKQHPLLTHVNSMLIDLPSPSNISYFWGYGSILGLILVIQLVTGIFLAMHYTPHVDLAFDSTEHIMRDVQYGWLLRYLHANGAGMFFICVFLHIGRGLYYGSYKEPRTMTWNIGVIIFLVMMGTAFMGYTLPWGSMSLWGATVITSMVGSVPFIGEDLVQWLWGGFCVGNATLNRFFSLHYLLPFVIAALAVIHLLALHVSGSGSPLGTNPNRDKIPFHPYYTTKDLFGYAIVCLMLALLVFFVPNMLGHSDNYIPANPLVTPELIQPEFYFLFAYTILRAFPIKLLGVIAMVASIVVLMVCPLSHTQYMRSLQFRPLGKLAFWFLVGDFFLLTYIGSMHPEDPWILIGQVATFIYFSYFIIMLPLIGYIENKLFFKFTSSEKKALVWC